MEYRIIENLAAEVRPPEAGLVNRVVFQDDSLKAVVFGFAAGHELAEHKAPFPVIVQILSGEARISLREKEISAAPGSWIHMEPHLPHSVTATTPMVMLLLVLKSAKAAAPGAGA